MIVTTSYNPNEDMKKRAVTIAEIVNGIYVERVKQSLSKIFVANQKAQIIVVEKERSKYLYRDQEQSFFFHPSMALLRINRLKQGDNDLMVQIAGLKKGDYFLDCTLGLATDSIVASFVAGSSGKVVGIESQSVIAALVKDGLIRGWPSDYDIDQSMKRIEIKLDNHIDYLKTLPNKSFDIVYFDPMFRYGLHQSSSINPIRDIANQKPLTEETVEEAKRIAKRKVILKENIASSEFERLGFIPFPRSVRSVTFGVINLDEDEYN